MSWSLLSAFEPALPEHCVPQNDFFFRFSSTFHTCVPTPLAFLSNTLGALSIVAWLFAQLPQIYKNWSIGSTSGLSVYFLVVWLLGDFGNFLGALFTHQASWQITIGAYYVFVDVCLVTQWLYYEKLNHGSRIMQAWKNRKTSRREGGDSDGSLNRVVIEGIRVPTLEQDTCVESNKSDDIKGQEIPQQPSRPRIIFRTPTFDRQENEKGSSSGSGRSTSNRMSRVGPSSPMPSPSPRTLLFVACLIALAQATPVSGRTSVRVSSSPTPTPLENAGTILSWISTILYLSSRLPQLFKNYRRKSTAGLSPHLFIAAFCGNLFYSSALFANPCAWYDFGPYGGGGWVGKEGSVRLDWVAAALPFFLGAFGVLGLDASVGIQFLMYGEKSGKLVVVESEGGRRWQLRRVSGWLRGWVPSFNDSNSRSGEEQQRLLHANGQHSNGYGAL